MRFPYGLADFTTLIGEGYCYKFRIQVIDYLNTNEVFQN